MIISKCGGCTCGDGAAYSGNLSTQYDGRTSTGSPLQPHAPSDVSVYYYTLFVRAGLNAILYNTLPRPLSYGPLPIYSAEDRRYLMFTKALLCSYYARRNHSHPHTVKVFLASRDLRLT